MRRIAVWSALTLTAVVLLFGYRTSTSSTMATHVVVVASAPATTQTPDSSATDGATSDGASSDPTPTASASTGSGSGSSSGTSTGDVAQTRWGPVQVAITTASGKITKVDVVEYPTENQRDQEINSFAVPTLVQETLAAQSAKIDMVSGATVTSDGYVQSLQSAIDKAGL